jgi:hypothetical protein
VGTLADLTVGERVHVFGTPPPPEVELKGTVRAVDTTSTPNTLTVNHITVNIDANTRFGGDAHSLANIHVGDFVGVAGTAISAEH